MKKWMLCASAAMLAACSQGGGGGELPATCNATPAQDPFETYGKVLVSSAESDARNSIDQLVPEDLEIFSDPAHAPLLSSLKKGATLKAGTELAVTLKEGCSDGGRITHQVREANKEESSAQTASGVRSYTWVLPASVSASELSKEAEGDACVVGLSDSQQTFASESAGDPLLADQGHLKMLEYGQANQLISTSSQSLAPVTIAIIDTGIDMNHEDLKANLWVNSGEVPGNGKDDDGNGYVDDVNGYDFATRVGSPQYKGSWAGNQHGTHVSGLAAARSGNGVGGSGVMGTAKIMMLNVFGASSGAASSAVANAIRYAADNGADVINLSLGGSGRSATYESALGYAISKGVVVVAAAGNERREVGPNYFMSPGAYGQQFAGMLTVGSVDSSDESLSTYSNYSSTYVEIAAPGSEQSAQRIGLLSTWPGNKYARIQGTSMASPVVAGAAAMAASMLKARGYARNPALIESILESSGKVDGDLMSKIRGGRVLNLKSMADLISSRFPAGGSANYQGKPGVSTDGCATGANL